jgi:hypothetical protein
MKMYAKKTMVHLCILEVTSAVVARPQQGTFVPNPCVFSLCPHVVPPPCCVRPLFAACLLADGCSCLFPVECLHCIPLPLDNERNWGP